MRVAILLGVKQSKWIFYRLYHVYRCWNGVPLVGAKTRFITPIVLSFCLSINRVFISVNFLKHLSVLSFISPDPPNQVMLFPLCCSFVGNTNCKYVWVCICAGARRIDRRLRRYFAVFFILSLCARFFILSLCARSSFHSDIEFVFHHKIPLIFYTSCVSSSARRQWKLY